MQGRRILVTGAAGQLGFPVAASLAETNEVWAAARFSNPAGRARLEAAGIRTASVDLAAPDWTELPDRFDDVLHFAAEIIGDDYDQAITVNAEGTGLLMQRYATARTLVVSSTVVYDLHPDERHPYVETDPLGDSEPLFGVTYPVGKIAQEAAARACARAFGVQTVIARMQLSYGANGGLPAYQLDAMRQGRPVTVAAHDTWHSPYHQSDIVASIPALLDAASCPATVTNWGGSEAVSMHTYLAYLAELEGHQLELQPIEGFIRSRVTDPTRQHRLLGRAELGWREGMERLVAERPPPEEQQ